MRMTLCGRPQLRDLWVPEGNMSHPDAQNRGVNVDLVWCEYSTTVT